MCPTIHEQLKVGAYSTEYSSHRHHGVIMTTESASFPTALSGAVSLALATALVSLQPKQQHEQMVGPSSNFTCSAHLGGIWARPKDSFALAATQPVVDVLALRILSSKDES